MALFAKFTEQMKQVIWKTKITNNYFQMSYLEFWVSSSLLTSLNSYFTERRQLDKVRRCSSFLTAVYQESQGLVWGLLFFAYLNLASRRCQ